MRPGTQQRLKHCVRAEISNKKPDTNASEIRYALSFRALSRPAAPSPEEKSHKQIPDQPDTLPKCSDQQTPPKCYVSLIAGDSYAARLDKSRLGKGRIVVENIAKGGAKISAVKLQLETYARTHPDTQVNKLIISVGTNDIRNARTGIDHLRGPLKELCTTIKDLFPYAKVYFQSLLPLPLKHNRDWSTNTTVIKFNWLIYHECTFRHFYYIDAYSKFRKFNRKGSFDPPARYDYYFEDNGIHPHPERGSGILAKEYLRALHSRKFNPFVFQ